MGEAVGEVCHGSREQADTWSIRSSSGSVHRFGSSLSDIFAHSWRRIPSASWRWIPKHACVGELGFIASSGAVRRWGRVLELSKG